MEKTKRLRVSQQRKNISEGSHNRANHVFPKNPLFKHLAVALLLFLSMMLAASGTVRITEDYVKINDKKIIDNFECVVDSTGYGDQLTLPACLNAINEGDIFVKNGTYSGANVNINNSNIKIYCEKGVVLSLSTDDVPYMIIADTIENVTVDGCFFQLNSKGGGIKANNASYCKITNNQFLNSDGGDEAVYFQGNNRYNRITDNYFQDNSWYSIRIMGGNNNYIERNIIINNGGHPIDVTVDYANAQQPITGTVIKDNIINGVTGSTASGITVYGAEIDGWSTYNVVEGNWINNTPNHGISMDNNHAYSSVKNNVILNVGQTAGNGITLNGFNNGTVSGNEIYYSGGGGIFLSTTHGVIKQQTANNNIIESNTIRYSGGTSINIRRDTNQAGITLKNNTIINNHIFDCLGSNYSIAVNSYNGTVEDTHLIMNDIHNCAGGMYDTGTGTNRYFYLPDTDMFTSNLAMNLSSIILGGNTISSWDDVNTSGSGDILAVRTNGNYLYGGNESGNADIRINTTEVERALTTNSTKYWLGYGDVDLQNAVDFDLLDDTSAAFEVSEGSNKYIQVDTTNTATKLTLYAGTTDKYVVIDSISNFVNITNLIASGAFQTTGTATLASIELGGNTITSWADVNGSASDTNETTRVDQLVISNSTHATQISTEVDLQAANNISQAAKINAKHTPATCAAGEAVQNTTTAGVECISITSASDTNETTRVDQLVISNTSQDSRLDAIEGAGYITADTNETTRVDQLVISNTSQDSRLDAIEGAGYITADTNETTRVDNLANHDCSAGYLVIGVLANGTVNCVADNTGNTSLGTDVVGDVEMNYSEVTLADFTNDANFITGNETTRVDQLVISNTSQDSRLDAIEGAGYITADTNETTRVDQLVISNTSQDSRLDAIEGAGYITADTNETTRVDQLVISNTSQDSRLDSLETSDALDYDEIGDLPTSSPANGDTANISTADQIYDWVTGLGYLPISEMPTSYPAANITAGSFGLGSYAINGSLNVSYSGLGYGFLLRGLNADPSVELLHIHAETAGFDTNVVVIENDGTAHSIFINQDGAGKGIIIDSESTTSAGIDVDMADPSYVAINTDAVIKTTKLNATDVEINDELIFSSSAKAEGNATCVVIHGATSELHIC